MATRFQITTNEVISGVCKALYDTLGTEVNIYKEKEPNIKLPAICVYCMDYTKTTERYDRFTNTFHIIINYFPPDSVIINNKRTDMFSKAEIIMEAVRYIQVPASIKNDSGELVQTIGLTRAGTFSVEEQEGFLQIIAPYTIRTKLYVENPKMRQIDLDITNNQTGG